VTSGTRQPREVINWRRWGEIKIIKELHSTSASEWEGKKKKLGGENNFVRLPESSVRSAGDWALWESGTIVTFYDIVRNIMTQIQFQDIDAFPESPHKSVRFSVLSSSALACRARQWIVKSRLAILFFLACLLVVSSARKIIKFLRHSCCLALRRKREKEEKEWKANQFFDTALCTVCNPLNCSLIAFVCFLRCFASSSSVASELWTMSFLRVRENYLKWFCQNEFSLKILLSGCEEEKTKMKVIIIKEMLIFAR
jgi:hypothetical protein